MDGFIFSSIVGVVFIVIAFVWGRALRTEETKTLRQDLRDALQSREDMRKTAEQRKKELGFAQAREKRAYENGERNGKENALREVAKGNQDTIELYFSLYDMAVKKYGDRHDEFLDFVLSWESRSFPAKQRQEWHGTDLTRR